MALIGIAATRWLFWMTRYAAPSAPPTMSRIASAASAGLRSRGALGGRRPPGAVGACRPLLSCGAGGAPRDSVPRSADMVPVSPLLADDPAGYDGLRSWRPVLQPNSRDASVAVC